MVATYLNTDWFPWQLMRRGINLAATAKEADSVPQFMELRSPQLFEAGAIHATIPAGYLTRDQIFVLRMIRDVLPRRPIYFSNSVYPRSLGLDPYLVTEGLAVHLLTAAVTESATVARTDAGMIDVPRSLALWRGTFRGRSAFERQNDWIDAASLGMPAQYVLAGSILAEGLGRQGRSAERVAVETDVQKLLGISNLGSVFGWKDYK